MAVEAKVVPEHLHTALRVKDLEGAVRFYTEVVGLRESRRNPNGVWVQGIQLIGVPDLDEKNKGVLDHIGIAVANIEEIMANVQKAGAPIERPVTDMSTPEQRLRIAFFRDPEGNRIELTDRT